MHSTATGFPLDASPAARTYYRTGSYQGMFRALAAVIAITGLAARRVSTAPVQEE